MKPLLRKAFLMKVNSDSHEEYERRHNPIWPELEAVLREHGVVNYSIFLHRESSQLFAFAEVEDEAQWQAIAATPVCRRWWQHMRELMPTNADNSPVADDLEEVFRLPSDPNESKEPKL